MRSFSGVCEATNSNIVDENLRLGFVTDRICSCCKRW